MWWSRKLRCVTLQPAPLRSIRATPSTVPTSTVVLGSSDA